MIRFYFRPTPDPAKVTVMPRETGLPHRSGPARHRRQKSGSVNAPAEQVLKDIGNLVHRRRFEN